MVLDLYERLQREMPRRDPRYRIEHCTVVNDDLVRRIKALGVIPTPFSTYVYFHGEKMPEYGEERLNSMFALAQLPRCRRRGRPWRPTTRRAPSSR